MTRTLIIGNGFDLQCGLKSRYKDFFESNLYKDIDLFFDSINYSYSKMQTSNGLEHIYFKSFGGNELTQIKTNPLSPENYSVPDTLSSLSFWDLLFFFDKQRLPQEWNIVEDRIKETLSDNRKLANLFQKIQSRSLENKISAVFYSFFPSDRWQQFDNHFDFLLAELHIFESNFSEYILNEVETNPQYYFNARNLAETLLQINGTNNVVSKNVLSFNYTQPFLEDNLKKTENSTGLLFEYSNNSIINIHGTAESSDAIFGVDPKGISTKNPLFFFTKTYRQLVTNNISKYSQMKFDSYNNWLVFFGHSLSENDYSYFEAIFDKLDLYNSSTVLIFKFSIFDKSREKEIELDMINKVTRLLEAYSSTLNNHDHRDNLLSRLLIERRLFISAI
ncbi:AbiH family protein [Enterococcus sp. LJL90]